MKAALPLLGLALLLGLVLLLDAAEESCVGQCGVFDKRQKCQCDSMCLYYGSCCADFDTVCPKKMARGDTFDSEDAVTETTTTAAPTFTTAAPVSSLNPSQSASVAPPTHADAAACSGRPFDAFLQLKNGSIYAFRGEYFFELDDKAVLPGYPKLIEDVWGIKGPVDAAFTRINCQGKSYIFKGELYWRFDGDVLDEDYPRNISRGFDMIPDHVDAAFALPAPSHSRMERAYFFKGDQYQEYVFKNQPSHEECVTISGSSPSVLFSRYTDLFCDHTWEDLLAGLFGTTVSSSQSRSPSSIQRGWRGLPPSVDAAMVGRVYLSPASTSAPLVATWRRRSHRRRPNNRRRRPSSSRRRSRRHILFDDLWDLDDLFDYSDFSDFFELPTQAPRGTPVQNVYFFKQDKYYRVNYKTKRVDLASPPYPRSIAKYWLGCAAEDTPTDSKAEKK